MSGFNTTNVETVVSVGQFLDPGRQTVSIYSGTLSNSERTGKKALSFVLVGPAPHDGYEGYLLDKNNKEGGRYPGPVGFINVSSWLTPELYNDTNPARNGILNTLMYFADSMGVRDQFNAAINGSTTIDEVVEKGMTVLVGKPFWIFLSAKEEEYQGKVRAKLNFFPSKSVSLKKENLEEFNIDNPYHYKKLKKAEGVTSFGGGAAAPVSEFDLPA